MVLSFCVATGMQNRANINGHMRLGNFVKIRPTSFKVLYNHNLQNASTDTV